MIIECKYLVVGATAEGINAYLDLKTVEDNTYFVSAKYNGSFTDDHFINKRAVLARYRYGLIDVYLEDNSRITCQKLILAIGDSVSRDLPPMKAGSEFIEFNIDFDNLTLSDHANVFIYGKNKQVIDWYKQLADKAETVIVGFSDEELNFTKTQMKVLEKGLMNHKLGLLPNCTINKIEVEGSRYLVSLSTLAQILCEKVYISTDRKPEKIEFMQDLISYNKNETVQIDSDGQSVKTPGIFAIGACAGLNSKQSKQVIKTLIRRG